MTETPQEFLARMRSIGVISRRTRDQVREGRRADGVRIKQTTDELNTTITEHAVGDRQDIHVRPGPITGQIDLKGDTPPWLNALTSRRS
jgi:hypothetical protein